jgi:predicted nucleic-acid-binding Zn-ribbon protein
MAEIEQTKVCPKCGQPMAEGYVPSRANKWQGQIPVWVSGQPVKRFWGGIDLDGKNTVAVQTFRCQGCGYLESYAK